MEAPLWCACAVCESLACSTAGDLLACEVSQTARITLQRGVAGSGAQLPSTLLLLTRRELLEACATIARVCLMGGAGARMGLGQAAAGGAGHEHVHVGQPLHRAAAGRALRPGRPHRAAGGRRPLSSLGVWAVTRETAIAAQHLAELSGLGVALPSRVHHQIRYPAWGPVTSTNLHCNTWLAICIAHVRVCRGLQHWQSAVAVTSIAVM